MSKKMVLALVAVVVCAAGCGGKSEAADRPGPPRPGQLLALIDLDGLPVLYDGARARMFASTDPTGRGNDCGNFLRVDGDEYVLAEMKGPGVITRIWSANAQGQLKIYLDGKPEPCAELPVQGAFRGEGAAFSPADHGDVERGVLQLLADRVPALVQGGRDAGRGDHAAAARGPQAAPDQRGPRRRQNASSSS